MKGRTYVPRSPSLFQVDKNGGQRDISLFQIADSAVSRLVYRRLMEKNRPLFSARSYAYRGDLTAHDCLQFVRSEWGLCRRLFIAEYDFSQFFDSLDHEHILRTLKDLGFLLTRSEQHVVEAFLAAPLPVAARYDEFSGWPRDRGVPQGTSISLFLANVAASPLDRALERLGVGFVRYADDILIWSADYAQICRAVEALYAAAERMGTAINLERTRGVRLLVEPGTPAEMEHTDAVDFVGYKVALGALSIKDTGIKKIKDRLRNLLFENLLRHPLGGSQNFNQLRGVDEDYAVFIWQARRYLYGDLSESDVRTFERGGVRLRRFKGVMAYYPLVEDSNQLIELDRWLADAAWLVMRKRARLLRCQGFSLLPPPHDLTISDLVKWSGTSLTNGPVRDLRLPSFQRIAGVIGRASKEYGPNKVGQRGMRYY